jgi:protein SCO1/2
LVLTIFAASCARNAQTAPPVLSEAGNFTLVNDDGQRFDLSSLRGSVVMMFFGFLSCPDICPTTLSKLASVQRRLTAQGFHAKTVYISVDPQRDTPAAMKATLSAFDLDAVGLTGTKADIDSVVAAYGGAYSITETPDSAMRYTVSHTTTIYVLDTAGRLRLQLRYETPTDEIVQAVKAVLAGS